MKNESMIFRKLTRDEMKALRSTMDRFYSSIDESQIDRTTLLMDLKKAVIYFNIDIYELNASDDVTFYHDTVGIINHVDRTKAPWEDDDYKLFIPRLSKSYWTVRVLREGEHAPQLTTYHTTEEKANEHARMIYHDYLDQALFIEKE